MSKDELNIEIRSQEVQELLGLVPRWIIRWGTIIIILVLALLFVLSKSITFPDIIGSQIHLTANIPPAELKAYAEGTIKKIYVEDQQQVHKNQLLAVIHSSADYNDVLMLSEFLSDTFSVEQLLMNELNRKKIELGSLQTPYASFVNTLETYQSFVDIDYYRKKTLAIEKEIFKYTDYLKGLKEQVVILEKEVELVETQYDRDSSLFIQGVLSKTNLEKSEESKLNKLFDLKKSNSALNQGMIQVSKLEQQKLELELQLQKQNKDLYSDLKSKWEKLKGDISVWKKSYLIESPFDGKVSLSKIWSENQFVKIGDVVMTVLPNEFDRIIGRATIQSSGYGKVKTGNSVIIKFDNYPYLEYGVVTGKVSRLSLTPEGGVYYAMVELDSTKLVTNYGTNLTFTQNMQGSAEIVTESRSLFDRIVAPVKSAVEIQEMYKR